MAYIHAELTCTFKIRQTPKGWSADLIHEGKPLRRGWHTVYTNRQSLENYIKRVCEKEDNWDFPQEPEEVPIEVPMTPLTPKELEMLRAFLLEGVSVNGAENAQWLIEDNMTWMNANDLQQELGWNKQSIGGVMGSLQDKGLIVDSGDSARGARINDWYADQNGIEQYFWTTTVTLEVALDRVA